MSVTVCMESPHMRLTSKQVGACFKLIRQHINPVPGTGNRFNYDQGWSDSLVAKEVGISIPQVRTMRKEAFGELPATGRPVKPNSLTAQVKALQEDVRQIKQSLSEHGYEPPLELSDERVHGSAAYR